MAEERHETIRTQRPLLALEGVTAAAPGGEPIGPITWSLGRGKRIAVACARPGQWESLAGLLSGRIRPREGRLEEVSTVLVQSDRNLQETLDLNQSIEGFLHSPDAPEFVWLQNRRRALYVLVDALDISPRVTRRPVKMEAGEVQDKYWALRFLISRAELLIGRDIFRLNDPAVRQAIRLRWPDLPGTVVAGLGEEELPGPVDARVRIDEGGAFTLQAVLGGEATPTPARG
jgi:hypothetical protein